MITCKCGAFISASLTDRILDSCPACRQVVINESCPITKEALAMIEPTPLSPDMFSMSIDDDFDIEHYRDALEESRYIAANTLGYFFDPDFDGTIQEYYDNTIPHA